MFYQCYKETVSQIPKIFAHLPSVTTFQSRVAGQTLISTHLQTAYKANGRDERVHWEPMMSDAIERTRTEQSVTDP